MNERIRVKARELLVEKVVDCVIGYERASDGVSARPALIYQPEDVERLVFDQYCVHNLTRFLRDRPIDKVTGIVCKPCDSRAINLLVNENQLARDRVYVIGVVCSGLKTAGGDKLQARCEACRQHVPVNYDFLVGEPPAQPVPPAVYPDVEDYEKMSPSERNAFWKKQFKNCIRCYACRQACPGCYCPECFVDQLDPTWVGIRIAPGENEVWNLIRAFHLAGRCISCGACEQACPVNIPLMLLNRKLEKDARELFGWEAGLDPEKAAPFNTFRKDEKLEGAE